MTCLSVLDVGSVSSLLVVLVSSFFPVTAFSKLAMSDGCSFVLLSCMVTSMVLLADSCSPASLFLVQSISRSLTALTASSRSLLPIIGSCVLLSSVMASVMLIVVIFLLGCSSSASILLHLVHGIGTTLTIPPGHPPTSRFICRCVLGSFVFLVRLLSNAILSPTLGATVEFAPTQGRRLLLLAPVDRRARRLRVDRSLKFERSRFGLRSACIWSDVSLLETRVQVRMKIRFVTGSCRRP